MKKYFFLGNAFFGNGARTFGGKFLPFRLAAPAVSPSTALYLSEDNFLLLAPTASLKRLPRMSFSQLAKILFPYFGIQPE